VHLIDRSQSTEGTRFMNATDHSLRTATTASPVAVDLSDISLSFGDTQVLRAVSLSIAPGEFFALLGPSGCGKSTLLRVIAGFNEAQHGSVRIDGRPVEQLPPWKRDVGMVFQSYALWPHMTVAGNVAFGLEERRMPREQVRRRVREALDQVGLANLASRRPGELSGGQQQRVALARTLAIQPRVLLLDEPLSNLDAKLRVHMRRELLAMQRQLGITTIFVTHDQEEAMTTADRIAVMSEGVVQQVGTPVELYDHPANRFVAEFVGTINLLHAPTSAGAMQCIFGSVPAPIGQSKDPAAALLAVRPHRIVLASGTAPDDGHLWQAAQVIEREFRGEFVRYRLDVQGVELLADRPHRGGAPEFDIGARVWVGVRPADLRALADNGTGAH
jgi:iron(III) transport system ATP-binding protein